MTKPDPMSGEGIKYEFKIPADTNPSLPIGARCCFFKLEPGAAKPGEFFDVLRASTGGRIGIARCEPDGESFLMLPTPEFCDANDGQNFCFQLRGPL